ncbi:MAG TPA: efflux RND transporter periplasmic adaptor subunit [Flavobacteriaceae bacterium]|nr:efflux RND transporter periplasmic adaptor subunit [Flavobacteriaceae bacterium]
MKRILIISLAFLAFACGKDHKSVDAILNSGDLSAIKAKRYELAQQQRDIRAELDKLDAYIDSHENTDRPVLVTAEVVGDTIFNHFVEVQGNVDTDQNMVLNGEFSGVLLEVYVKEGQHVTKGQRLARIDDGGLASQVAQQEAQLALTKTTFERQERLWKEKIGSEIQFLQAQTNYRAAQKANEQLQAQLRKTYVTAPFSGIIDDVMADPGQLIAPGQTPVIRLVNLNNMYVKASIPENYLKSIRKGTEVVVSLPSVGEEFMGKVSQVSNYINPNNRSFEIKVDIPNKEGLVKPNQIATVRVNDYTAPNAIVIPENIIQHNSKGESLAFIYQPLNDSIGEAKRTLVETGHAYGNRVEILSGINKGDLIIVEGARSLRDGQKVIIRK